MLKGISNSLKFSILILKKKIPVEPTLSQPQVNPIILNEFEIGLDEWHTKMKRQMN